MSESNIVRLIAEDLASSWVPSQSIRISPHAQHVTLNGEFIYIRGFVFTPVKCKPEFRGEKLIFMGGVLPFVVLVPNYTSAGWIAEFASDMRYFYVDIREPRSLDDLRVAFHAYLEELGV